MIELLMMFDRNIRYRTPCLSDGEFEHKLRRYLSKGESINAHTSSMTLLDYAKRCGEVSKVKILKHYGDAKTYEELYGVRRTNIGSRIVAPAEPHYAMGRPAISMAPVEWSDFDAGDDLYKVIPFLKTPAIPGDRIREKLVEYARCIGLLTASGMGIGTAFLISPFLIITARHCLNEVALGELEISFDFLEQERSVVAAVESGRLFNLDYAVLRLNSGVFFEKYSSFIPAISYDRSQKPCFTFMGYDEDGELSFTNHRASALHAEGVVGTYQDSVQETGFGFSGSPYFDEHGRIYALHQNTGLDKKQSVYFAEIGEKNKSSLFNLPSDLWESVPDELTYGHAVFSSVSFSETSQYDEGKARGMTLGKNPSIKKDELGGNNNIVCQEVLYRWALKDKARYVGLKLNRREWIRDSENWEVKVRKTDDGAREWVKIDVTRARGRLAIQMGHKLSAVSYWVYGYNLLTNIILQEFFDAYEKEKGKVKADAKKVKYAARYSLFNTPGFQQVEAGHAVINRQFMYSSANYRFEWADLNEQHGKEESRKLTYEAISSRGARYTLDQYRRLRNDKATTPTIRANLRDQKTILEGEIAANFARFVKK